MNKVYEINVKEVDVVASDTIEKTKCPECDGRVIQNATEHSCYLCNGSGYIWIKK
jgi:DnaJ-class molecular chaperone